MGIPADNSLCLTCENPVKSKSPLCSNPCHTIAALEGSKYKMEGGVIIPSITNEEMDALYEVMSAKSKG